MGQQDRLPSCNIRGEVSNTNGCTQSGFGRKRMIAVRSTDYQECYQRITDQVPMGSPVLVEDGDARGKSVLTRQIMYGVMRQGLSVTLFTTGSTTRRFIKHFGSIRLAVSHYLGPAYLKELRPDVVGFKWNKDEIELSLGGCQRQTESEQLGTDHLNLKDRGV
jgi:archaellum biogenesis ATPase FlaH